MKAVVAKVLFLRHSKAAAKICAAAVEHRHRQDHRVQSEQAGIVGADSDSATNALLNQTPMAAIRSMFVV